MSPTGESGALHTNERFLFSCLSECVTVSPSERQHRVWVPGGVRIHEPPTSTGLPLLDFLAPLPALVLGRGMTPKLPPELLNVPSELRAWSRKPMKSRELRTVTKHRHVEGLRHKKIVVNNFKDI